MGRVVITDRLHAHILCLLMQIPHVLLNNAVGKTWTFYETWTRDSPLCHLALDAKRAWNLATSSIEALPSRESRHSGWSQDVAIAGIEDLPFPAAR
jgi:pyruvyl transferase EpsO